MMRSMMLLSSLSIPLLSFTTVSAFVDIHNNFAARTQNAAAADADESLLALHVTTRRDDTHDYECNSLSSVTKQSRRDWLKLSSSSFSSLLLPILLCQSQPTPQPALALEEDSPTVTTSSSKPSTPQIRIPTDVTSGSLPDLPPEAVRSYLQYRFPLQLAADYYIFDLQTQVSNVDEYGNISDLLNSQGGGRGGQGGSSRLERDFVNPMRIIGLSMPPDVADNLRSNQFQFELAMSKLRKVTSGIRRDLPVEIDVAAVVPKAQEAWNDGRLALNSYFEILNSVTGLKGEMVSIPPSGLNQVKVSCFIELHVLFPK